MSSTQPREFTLTRSRGPLAIVAQPVGPIDARCTTWIIAQPRSSLLRRPATVGGVPLRTQRGAAALSQCAMKRTPPSSRAGRLLRTIGGSTAGAAGHAQSPRRWSSRCRPRQRSRGSSSSKARGGFRCPARRVWSASCAGCWWPGFPTPTLGAARRSFSQRLDHAVALLGCSAGWERISQSFAASGALQRPVRWYWWLRPHPRGRGPGRTRRKAALPRTCRASGAHGTATRLCAR